MTQPKQNLSKDELRLVQNALDQRFTLLNRLIGGKDTRSREIDGECGYPEVLTISDYRDYFERHGVAKRVVSLYPEECWKKAPDIYETEDPSLTPFEKSWTKLAKRFKLNSVLKEADIHCGIGTFGVILLGLNDGKDLDQPVNGLTYNNEGDVKTTAKTKLIYLRVFDESCIKITEFETDKRSFRYGAPKFYSVSFDQQSTNTMGNSYKAAVSITKIHWHRIIHLVPESATNSTWFGHPRMEGSYDRLFDMKKVVGGSGEMFWKGGFPGISFETDPTLLEKADFDQEALEKQITAYSSGLQRYLSLVGVSAKSLNPQVADPKSHFEILMKCVAIHLACPVRILMGTEEAQMAGDQDSSAWNERLKGRQHDYVSPCIIEPFVNRMMDLGCIEPLKDREEGVKISWPNLYTRTEKDKAAIAKTTAEAFITYIEGGGSALMDPRDFLIHVCQFTEQQADMIITNVGSSDLDLPDPLDPNDEMAMAPTDPTKTSKTTRPSRAKIENS